MAPPHVDLSEQEAYDGAFPRDKRAKYGDDDVRYRSENAVEQYGRILRYDRVVPVRTPPVVVRAKVQRKPKMLRNVVKERRREIAGYEGNDHGGNRHYDEHGRPPRIKQMIPRERRKFTA
jgi:hypothetical protein